MKGNKYGVSSKADRTYKGVVYDSKLEMNYRRHLDLMTKATKPSEKVVSILEQVQYDITVSGKKICKYILDFEVEYADGRIEYVDVKGIKTAIYSLKKKLVEALYPNTKIKEIKKGDF